MFNLRLATDRLLYRLRATTRHGTHSPFVYRLVDEVIYDLHAKKVYPPITSRKGLLKTSKVAQLLFRLAADLQPNNIIAMDAAAGDTALYLQQTAPKAEVHILTDGDHEAPGTFDLILIENDTTDTILQHFEAILPKAHQTTMLVIAGIYRTQELKAAWAHIKAHPQVTVTIDLFSLGLVFFRKGQVKEDFTIKI